MSGARGGMRRLLSGVEMGGRGRFGRGVGRCGSVRL